MAQAFVGAVFGSVATLIAQWFFGPRIERRVRAQERWEQFLIEYATAINGPVRRAQVAARQAWIRWEIAHGAAADPPDDALRRQRIAELKQEYRSQYRDAIDVWEESTKRLEWLEKRIAGWRHEDTELRHFEIRSMLYRGEPFRWFASIDQEPPGDETDWATTEAAYDRLVASVETLSVRIGPPATARQWWRGYQKRLRARAATEQRGTESGS